MSALTKYVSDTNGIGLDGGKAFLFSLAHLPRWLGQDTMAETFRQRGRTIFNSLERLLDSPTKTLALVWQEATWPFTLAVTNGHVARSQPGSSLRQCEATCFKEING